MKKSRSDRFVIRENVGSNNRSKSVVRPLKSGYTYASALDEDRINRSLARINRRIKK